jgi:hypothetical protein
MMPVIPTATIYGGPRSDDFIKQLKAQNEAHIKMGNALYQFLSRAFPNAIEEARQVGQAYVDLMTVGSARQIEIMEAQNAAMESYRPNPVNLTKLVEQRDQLQDQLDQAHRAIEAMADSMPKGYADLVESTMLQSVKDQLKSVNEQISFVQAEMERSQTGDIE